jgi:hypothetical protein
VLIVLSTLHAFSIFSALEDRYILNVDVFEDCNAHISFQFLFVFFPMLMLKF